MKCEDCNEDAKWRINDGVNAWGSIIYIHLCDVHLKEYRNKIKKLKRGIHLNGVDK